MNRLGVIAALAVRNIKSYRFRTFVIVAIVALGTCVLVLGLSMVRTMDAEMKASTTGSLTGDIQVWSKKGPDRLRLINLGADAPDIGEIPDFEQAAAEIMAVEGVRTVVPMATGVAVTQRSGQIDVAVEDLREAYAAKDQSLIDSVRADIQSASGLLEDGLTESGDHEGAAVARKFSDDAFWTEHSDDPETVVRALDGELATIAPVPQPFVLNFIASNPETFQREFSRFRLVAGDEIPSGRRGLMIADRYFNRQLKHPVARELDWFANHAEAGRDIDKSTFMKGYKETLGARGHQLAMDIKRSGVSKVRTALQGHLDTSESDLTQLLDEFLQVATSNVSERRKFFHEHIAPTIPLHFLKPGDDVILRGFSKNGYLRSVSVKFYGTFVFEGLEDASLTNTLHLMDLVSWRELYGQMSADQLAELQDIRDEIGVEIIPAGDMEDQLFGGDDPVLEEADPMQEPLEESVELPLLAEEEEKTIPIPANVLRPTNNLAPTPRADKSSRDYSLGQMNGGLITSIAVFAEPGVDAEEVMARLNTSENLQANDWREAAGLVGQFVTAMTGILWGAVGLIFLIALFVLNNTILVSTMERVVEIGTLRALGARRVDVLKMVLLEAVVASISGGILGICISIAVLSWLGNVGIPAPTSDVTLLFGGDRLYPQIFTGDLLMAVLVVVVITLVSTVQPARFATRIPPVVAMRGHG